MSTKIQNAVGIFRSFDRFTNELIAIVFVLILALAALGEGYVSLSRSSQTAASVAAVCPFWRDLAQIPLTENSTAVAFTIVADARVAYAKQQCSTHTGPLQKPDPRVIPYLPHGVP